MAGGKPPLKIDLDILRGLAATQHTIEDIAGVFHCHPRTMKRYLKKPAYRDVWEEGRGEGRSSLRRRQWAIAMLNTNAGARMCEFLGHQWLGQGEKIKVQASGEIAVKIVIDAIDLKL
jgi:hypothetical protein